MILKNKLAAVVGVGLLLSSCTVTPNRADTLEAVIPAAVIATAAMGVGLGVTYLNHWWTKNQLESKPAKRTKATYNLPYDRDRYCKSDFEAPKFKSMLPFTIFASTLSAALTYFLAPEPSLIGRETIAAGALTAGILAFLPDHRIRTMSGLNAKRIRNLQTQRDRESERATWGGDYHQPTREAANRSIVSIDNEIDELRDQDAKLYADARS